MAAQGGVDGGRRQGRGPSLTAAVVTMMIIVIVAVAFAATGGASAETPAGPFRVIVNPRNATDAVDRRFLTEAFLKKTTRWRDGAAIRPVDLVSDSPVRRRFTDEVLNRSVAAVKSYWQQAIFAGRDIPPPELESDEAVVRFVLRYPGAVGYVSGAVNLGGARVLRINE
jgi:hypothetical protein